MQQAKGSRPYRLMGVLNATPDSFFDGSRFLAPEAAVQRAAAMLEEGADIIDIGGESTRPYAAEVAVDEELTRVLPVIRALRRALPQAKLSIDTRKPDVARAALEEGVAMVNDVSGLTDERMQQLVQRFDCEAVVMHMRGTPQTMQQSPAYEDVVGDIRNFFRAHLEILRQQGLNLERIVIDPGIGFGKSVEHNLALLHHLQGFSDLGRPILVGASRKSFIGKTLELPEAQRLEGSLAAAVLAYAHGASILRVHDVRETGRALRMARAILEA